MTKTKKKKVNTTANAMQVGGGHYGGREFQHWDWAVANFGPGYLASQATKYIVRWRTKDGLKDLQKALHYVDKLIEVHLTGLPGSQFVGGVPFPPVREARQVDLLILTYKLTPPEYQACVALAVYRTAGELQFVRGGILYMIENAS